MTWFRLFEKGYSDSYCGGSVMLPEKQEDQSHRKEWKLSVCGGIRARYRRYERETVRTSQTCLTFGSWMVGFRHQS